jgi:hypothetical protein
VKKDAERKARWRQSIVLERAQHIESSPPPWSARSGAISRQEVADYQEQLRRWEVQHPAEGWERPTRETAEAAAALLSAWLPVPLEDIHADRLTAQQLLVVALDSAVVAGRYGKRRVRTERVPSLRRVRQHLTRTKFFDVLARRWSPTHRQAREDGRAFSVFQQRESTIMGCRRDLLLEGITIQTLWEIVTGDNPLFRVRRAKRWEDGFNVTLKPGAILRGFERLVQQDTVYGPSRVQNVWRLWVEDAPRPAVETHPAICAEQPFNVVEIGPGTTNLLKIQEDTRLVFDPAAFVADYEQIRELRSAIRHQVARPGRTPMPDYDRRLRARISKFRAFLLEFRFVYEQARKINGPVTIRSSFYKVLNRRFQPAHFWIMEVSGKLDRAEPRWKEMGPPPMGTDLINAEYYEMTSARSRWFSTPDGQPLVHLDVASSQFQITAVFADISTLERDSMLSGRPLKKAMAERVWEQRAQLLNEGYEEEFGPGADDPRLVDAVKNLLLRIGYGSEVHNIVRAHAKDRGTYGPGWLSDRAVNAFLGSESVPWFESVISFLKACRWIGQHADVYAGVEMVDPLDCTTFRWNPTERADVRLELNDWALTAMVPGRYLDASCPKCKSSDNIRRDDQRTCGNRTCKHTWTARFVRAVDRGGVYPANRVKLRNMVAPCTIHMLDALFSAHVMRELHARGVRAFAGVHDAWFVAENARPVLEQAILAAGQSWLLALGPVFTALAKPLRRGSTLAVRDPDAVAHLAMVEEAEAAWRSRCTRKDWPKFYVAGDAPRVIEVPGDQSTPVVGG